MDGMNQPNFLSIDEALRSIQDGELTAESLVEACSSQIARLNPELNAFVTVLQPPQRGSHNATGRLAGIPVAVKDLFETQGVTTTAGSLFFKEYVPDSDAVAVQKVKEAGAVIMGKTNTHEIALGVTTINPHFGATHNPWDTARMPGGSSGGSAVAVATGMSIVALGTDTGGSIRIPASLCGVVGLKPTYGRVSLRGVFPLSWNLDHVGPLARTVRDAAVMLNVLAGYDPDDPSSEDRPADDYLEHIEEGIRGWRIAVAKGPYVNEADPEVLQAIEAAAKAFEGLGAKLERVDMTFLREAAVANSLMTPADGAAYHQERLAQHPEMFGTDVRQRLETGRAYSSTEYALARRAQTEIKHGLGRFFRDYHALLLPSTPIAAPLIEGNDAVEQARRLTRFTAPFNLTGLPAISVPGGFNNAGLPVGLQIIGGAWREALVLQAARAYERETGWSAKMPPLAG